MNEVKTCCREISTKCCASGGNGICRKNQQEQADNCTFQDKKGWVRRINFQSKFDEK